MGKFCRNCGNPLTEEAKFCTKCGGQVMPFTQQIPIQTDTNAAKSAATPASGSVSVVKQAAAMLGGNAFTASTAAGEVMIGSLSPLSMPANILNPMKTILNGVKSIFTSLKYAFTNKKGLITAILLAVVWILLTLLPILGIDPLPVKVASWLTFAQGGLRGGAVGLIGGIFGKGMFVTLLVSLITGGMKGSGSGFQKLFSGFRGGSAPTTLIGIGVAFILFNFMAGTSSPEMSMAGISGFLLSLRALSGKGGFIRRLASSATAKKKGNYRIGNTTKCTALISGLTLGFGMATALSFIPWAYTPYCVGAVTLIIGVILSIILGTKREVSEQ